MSSVLPDIHVNFNLFLVMYMYDQNFLLLDQDGVLVGNTVYVLSREKNCLQLCINIGILSITLLHIVHVYYHKPLMPTELKAVYA